MDQTRRLIIHAAALARTSYARRLLNTLPSALVAYWPLWEPVGAPTCLDISGHGCNGVYHAVTLGAPGIGDGHTAALFDGSTSYVDLYSVSLRDNWPGAAGTLLTWGKMTAPGWADGSAHYLNCFVTTASDFIEIPKNSTHNTLGYAIKSGGVARYGDYTIPGGGPAGWFCAVQTWDKAADEFKCYYNGPQAGITRSGFGVWSGTLLNTRAEIGSEAAATAATKWPGSIAHVALWNVALTAAQIASLARH